MSSNAFSELEREYSESLDYTERYTQMMKELAESQIMKEIREAETLARQRSSGPTSHAALHSPHEGDERNI